MNYGEIENMSGPITGNEIKYVIKKLPTNKSSGPGGFTGELYQTFREELTHILLKLFKNLQRSEYFQYILLGDNHPDKDITKKENYRLIPLMNIDGKILNNTSKPIPTIL